MDRIDIVRMIAKWVPEVSIGVAIGFADELAMAISEEVTEVAGENYDLGVKDGKAFAGASSEAERNDARRAGYEAAMRNMEERFDGIHPDDIPEIKAVVEKSVERAREIFENMIGDATGDNGSINRVPIIRAIRKETGLNLRMATEFVSNQIVALQEKHSV